MQAKFHLRTALFIECSGSNRLISQKIHEIFHFSFSLLWENQYNLKKPPEKEKAARNGQLKLKKHTPRWPCRRIKNLHVLAGGSPPQRFTASNVRPNGREACKPRYEGASRFVNVGFNKSITHHAGCLCCFPKRRNYSSSSSSNRYSMNCS